MKLWKNLLTGVAIISAVVVIGCAVVAFVGFTPIGVAAGSAAAEIHATIEIVATGSAFAIA